MRFCSHPSSKGSRSHSTSYFNKKCVKNSVIVMKILWDMLSRGYKLTKELHICMYLSVHTRTENSFGIFFVKVLLVGSVSNFFHSV